LSFAAGAGVLGSLLATRQAGLVKLRERNYSNPTKFVRPDYANIGDLEAVSDANTMKTHC